ncbi:MAG: hypothetical protein LBJ81_00400 [Puniceicoccales bacterium]|jgi:hypothetical protein|nr:hypothetical protein [Puniceicoccales bacterium]
MGRILRDAIISLGFMAIFLEASSSFAGKSGKSIKRNASASAVSEREKEIQEKRDKFLAKLAKAIQENDLKAIEHRLRSLAYPPTTSKSAKKAMLRSYVAKNLAIRMVLDDSDLNAMDIPFLAELIAAIHGTLPIAEYASIHDDYRHIFARKA